MSAIIILGEYLKFESSKDKKNSIIYYHSNSAVITSEAIKITDYESTAFL